MELKMFTSRVVASGPLKHLIFLLLSIKCQHVSEFISTLHFDVCLPARLVLETSWWHPNRILLTRPPSCCCCRCSYFTKCLWVCCGENTGDKGIGIVFLGASHSGSVGSFHSQQIDTVICDSHKKPSHATIASVTPVPTSDTAPGMGAAQLWSPWHWGSDCHILVAYFPDSEDHRPKKMDNFVTICKFRAASACEPNLNSR